MSDGNHLSNVNRCGLAEAILFVLAVLFGTACSISGKIMMDMTGTNGIDMATGEPIVEVFRQPLFLNFGMFLGMLFGLVRFVMRWSMMSIAGVTVVAASGDAANRGDTPSRYIERSERGGRKLGRMEELVTLILMLS